MKKGVAPDNPLSDSKFIVSTLMRCNIYNDSVYNGTFFLSDNC